MNQRVMDYVKAFIAGFVSTLAFHQGCSRCSISPVSFPARLMTLGIPAVISLAFWGGVWGAAIWPLLKNVAGPAYWLRALVIGAVGPSAVALFMVMPLKGMPMAGGWEAKLIVGALILNGAWGLGMALLLRLMRQSLRRSPG